MRNVVTVIMIFSSVLLAGTAASAQSPGSADFVFEAEKEDMKACMDMEKSKWPRMIEGFKITHWPNPQDRTAEMTARQQLASPKLKPAQKATFQEFIAREEKTREQLARALPKAGRLNVKAYCRCRRDKAEQVWQKVGKREDRFTHEMKYVAVECLAQNI